MHCKFALPIRIRHQTNSVRNVGERHKFARYDPSAHALLVGPIRSGAAPHAGDSVFIVGIRVRAGLSGQPNTAEKMAVLNVAFAQTGKLQHHTTDRATPLRRTTCRLHVYDTPSPPRARLQLAATAPSLIRYGVAVEACSALGHSMALNTCAHYCNHFGTGGHSPCNRRRFPRIYPCKGSVFCSSCQPSQILSLRNL